MTTTVTPAPRVTVMSVKLSKECAEDILTTAIESAAIQYWTCDESGIPISIRRDRESGNVVTANFVAENAAGETVPCFVDANVIQMGVSTLFAPGFDIDPRILQSIIDDDVDQLAADCIIQAALFGALLYG